MAQVKRYETREEAEAAIATMRGWEAEAVEYEFPSEDGSRLIGWAIEVSGYGDPKYVREDESVN